MEEKEVIRENSPKKSISTVNVLRDIYKKNKNTIQNDDCTMYPEMREELTKISLKEIKHIRSFLSGSILSDLMNHTFSIVAILISLVALAGNLIWVSLFIVSICTLFIVYLFWFANSVVKINRYILQVINDFLEEDKN